MATIISRGDQLDLAVSAIFDDEQEYAMSTFISDIYRNMWKIEGPESALISKRNKILRRFIRSLYRIRSASSHLASEYQVVGMRSISFSTTRILEHLDERFEMPPEGEPLNLKSYEKDDIFDFLMEESRMMERCYVWMLDNGG